MNYMKISDAVNDGVKKLIAKLSQDKRQKIHYVETDDIGASFKNLAEVLMLANNVPDSVKAEIEKKHEGDGFSAADNMGMVMDVLIASVSVSGRIDRKRVETVNEKPIVTHEKAASEE